jgi:hypothetical protein
MSVSRKRPPPPLCCLSRLPACGCDLGMRSLRMAGQCNNNQTNHKIWRTLCDLSRGSAICLQGRVRLRCRASRPLPPGCCLSRPLACGGDFDMHSLEMACQCNNKNISTKQTTNFTETPFYACAWALLMPARGIASLPESRVGHLRNEHPEATLHCGDANMRRSRIWNPSMAQLHLKHYN